MIDEVDDFLFRPIARFALIVARALWWLSRELLVETVGWSIGWLIWRLLSFGRFPDTGFGDLEQTSGWAALLVEFTGLAAIALTIWGLTAYVS
ncbi:hypothetical protein ASD78_13670 [Lysobacter sp. Root667]|uniref:hypothetical protein n=1 Tax=Lysobacter sp. Root667 TaxID=1736581 RepID=UPI000715E0F8|nr:hypothetical protein [Lysobacter sp. Root667]KRA74507.1 hypothetical protein ASD78_13670 [Lysobacter sp. Root667]